MAQKVTVELVDDIDGTPLDGDGGTVTFALERKLYEIDLSSENLGRLRDALAPYIEAARPAASSAAPRLTASARKGSASRDLGAVRAWARDNGYTVSDRGRVPATVLEAYDAAH